VPLEQFLARRAVPSRERRTKSSSGVCTSVVRGLEHTFTCRGRREPPPLFALRRYSPISSTRFSLSRRSTVRKEVYVVHWVGITPFWRGFPPECSNSWLGSPKKSCRSALTHFANLCKCGPQVPEVPAEHTPLTATLPRLSVCPGHGAPV